MIWFVTITQIILSYAVEARKIASERRLNLYSEMTVLFVSHFFIIFNMVSIEENFFIGYMVIGFIAAYCGLFFLIILKDLYYT